MHRYELSQHMAFSRTCRSALTCTHREAVSQGEGAVFRAEVSCPLPGVTEELPLLHSPFWLPTLCRIKVKLCGTASEAPRSCLSMCFPLCLSEFSSPVGFLTHRTAPQEDPTSLLFCVGIQAPPPGSLPCLPPLASGNCCSS